MRGHASADSVSLLSICVCFGVEIGTFANDRDDAVGYLRNLPDESRPVARIAKAPEQTGIERCKGSIVKRAYQVKQIVCSTVR